tara:strand:+ start:841 stop:1530 length:690 start_codon:yes stop_codon:yes gene_type:complete
VNSLTALVPFFNEEKTLHESVSRLLSLDIFNEIILINDSSNDKSPLIADELEKQNRNIILVSTKQNLGKGGALNYAKNLISSDFVVIHDADLEYYPRDIVNLFNLAIKEKTMVIGSRFKGDGERKNLYFRTFYANKFFSMLFSILFNCKLTDVATCYKLMPSSFLKNQHLTQVNFNIEIELLFKYLKTGNNILELPISYIGRSYEEGKKIKTSDGISFLRYMIKLKRKN